MKPRYKLERAPEDFFPASACAGCAMHSLADELIGCKSPHFLLNMCMQGGGDMPLRFYHFKEIQNRPTSPIGAEQQEPI